MNIRITTLVFLGIFLCSCSNIPNKPILDPLSINELDKIIKEDTLFADFYESVQKEVSEFNEIEKEKFNNITYRGLYKAITYDRDTVKLNSLKEKWITEWNAKFSIYREKLDSVLNYWEEHKRNNSLDRFVRVEFSKLDKEYYSYNYEVKCVNLGFSLTPLQGEIEQLKFNYRYSAKINDVLGEKHRCINTSPFSVPTVMYWEAGYSDEKRLKNTSTSEFLRDYNVVIEITDVRKDGINYSIDDLNIPMSIQNIQNFDSLENPYIHAVFKDVAIQEILCNEYRGQDVFTKNKYDQLIKEEFPKEFEFIEYKKNKHRLPLSPAY